MIGSKYISDQQNDSYNLFFTYENLDDAFLVTVFLRIILPIAYQVFIFLKIIS